MDHSSDNHIMMQVKAGDIDKLGILFERYKDKIFRYFYHSTGSRVDSEDLVQTVFFRILKYREHFSGYGKFTSWMYHIARNAKVDLYRKNKNHSRNEDILPDMVESQTSTEKAVLENEQNKLLETAFKQLGEEQKEILILSKYQELKYKQIAEILDCSEGNVKIKVYRALKELKQIYNKLEES